MQIIIVLCEGPHDVAFICRILKASGFKSNENTKIGEFPFPMNNLLINEIKKTDIAGLNLTEIRRSLLPVNTLSKNKNYVFLYSLGGDGKKEIRQQFLKELRLLIPDEGEIVSNRLSNDIALSVLYFFDADRQGIDNRLAQINLEISEVFNELTNNPFSANASFTIISKLKIGNYIFTGSDNNTGKLEDILLPLMLQENDRIFADASAYLAKNFDDNRLFPIKLNLKENVLIESRSIKSNEKERYDEKKSTIGVVAQLQHSGKSNVVCISDSDYLTLNKIQSNEKCQEIIAFFNQFIS